MSDLFCKPSPCVKQGGDCLYYSGLILSGTTINSGDTFNTVVYKLYNYINSQSNGGGSGVTDGDKGDITISGTGAIYTIDNDVVTFAKMQNISSNRLLGRYNAGTGDVEQIQIGANLTLSGGVLSAGSSGETNTASNLGVSGARVFSSKVGVDLQFRRLVSTNSSVTLTEASNDINLALVNDNASPGADMQYATNNSGVKGWYAKPAGSSGEINTASNVGTGFGWFKQKSGVNLEFKTFIASNGLSITNNTNDLQLSGPTLSNVGAGQSVYKGLTGSTHEFRTINAGANVSISTVGNEIVITGIPTSWSAITSKPVPEKFAFIVGVGQLMENGNTTLSNPSFVNNDVDVIRNSIPQAPFDPGGGGSYYTKATLASNTLTFFPAVADGELIQIRVIKI